MNRNIDKITIERTYNDEWMLWIPPSKPEHRDESGAVIGPYGHTYFLSLSEAAKFLVNSAIPDMLKTGWEPKYLAETIDV